MVFSWGLDKLCVHFVYPIECHRPQLTVVYCVGLTMAEMSSLYTDQMELKHCKTSKKNARCLYHSSYRIQP